MESSTKWAPDPLAPGAPGTDIPEWELPDVNKRKSRRSLLPTLPALPSLPSGSSQNPFRGLSEKGRRKMHCQCCYVPIDRKWLMIITAGVIIVIIAVGVGIGVGVTKGKSSKDQNVPLPNNAQPQVGQLTYYGVGLGACGINSNDNQDVVAVSHSLFDAASTGSDPNANPLCGKKIRAKRYYVEEKAERSVDLTVVDRCVGCQPTDLDVSTAVFEQLAPIPSGRVDVTWAWLSPDPTGT